MYQTVIVEDDPTISLLHRTFLARDNRFALVRAFSNGHEALEWLLHHTADLIILDVYMPRMTGLELLRTLRMEGIGIDVIMVTAANDSKTVDALLKLGVTDYLVKPFAASRFQQALDTFCQHREAVSHDNVSQQELDTLGKEYSADKIYRAQEIGKENNKTATQVLEEYEQDGAWSKLLKEGE